MNRNVQTGNVVYTNVDRPKKGGGGRFKRFTIQIEFVYIEKLRLFVWLSFRVSFSFFSPFFSLRVKELRKISCT